jgi:4-aminobutyrate aminotransferase / (S)-3-amino-2-methylpropionate transaminase
LKAILSEIGANNLIDNTRITGDYMHKELEALQRRFCGRIENVRGSGTFLAFDATKGVDDRNSLVTALRQKGVLVGGCGDRSIRIRPGLWFKPRHAAEFLDAFEAVLSR